MLFNQNLNLKSITTDQLHVLAATWFGMLFDGMDMSIYVLTLYPSLSELLMTKSHATVGIYGSIILAIFLFGWTSGALIFGILADYIGRTKTLIITVLLYAICTGLCATSHSWQELAFYRFLVGCGIGGEISIGGVMLSEYWSGKARLHATSFLQCAFNVGCLFLAIVGLALGSFGWRVLYVAGIIPALLAIYIRSKLVDTPEVNKIRAQRLTLQKKPKHELNPGESNLLKFTFFELFEPKNLRRVLIVCTLASTTMAGHYAVVSWIPAWINQLTGTSAIQERSIATIVLNTGAILGALSGGLLITFLGRPKSFRFAFAGAFACCLGMYLTVKSFGMPLLAWALVAGFFVMIPYTYLFIYVPELFSTHIRATAFGFSIQAGRIFAGILALIGGQLVAAFGGSYASAGACVASVYIVGFIVSFFMPKSDGTVTAEYIPESPKNSQVVSVSS
jgi:MFS family permease